MKIFSLLYQGDLHPSTDEKIIASSDYSKLVEAKEVIEKAKKDRERLLQETSEECERLKQEASAKGFEEGLAKFNEQLVFIELQFKALRLQMQQMVLPIALKAAKRIVGKELELYPDTIVDIVMQAIKPIKESHKVTIFVNKLDKEHLDEEKPALKELLSQTEVLTIQERNDIAPGGCIIQTEAGMINATIENQWKAMERAFEKYKQST